MKSHNDEKIVDKYFIKMDRGFKTLPTGYNSHQIFDKITRN